MNATVVCYLSQRRVTVSSPANVFHLVPIPIRRKKKKKKLATFDLEKSNRNFYKRVAMTTKGVYFLGMYLNSSCFGLGVPFLLLSFCSWCVVLVNTV